MKFTLRFFAVLLALEFLAGQLHEFTHHAAARALTGVWGRMTFNRFFYAPGVASDPRLLWGTAAGPILTYILIFVGLAMLRTRGGTAGYLLIFANLPLARIATAVFGHGDEVVVAKGLGLPWQTGLAVTVLLLAWPLYAAWRMKPKAGAFAAMLFAPLAFDGVVKILALERVLARVGSVPAIAGVPLLVIAVDLLFAIALLVTATFVPLRHSTPAAG